MTRIQRSGTHEHRAMVITEILFPKRNEGPKGIRAGDYIAPPHSEAYIELDAEIRKSEEALLAENPDVFKDFFRKLGSQGIGMTISQKRGLKKT